jgi:hypothetical protein
MNERIKELYIKTLSEECSNPALVDIEKFAELIVEECCKRLGEETISHDGYGYNQHELYNRLRKHFGVES